jgi:hypothetical protein
MLSLITTLIVVHLASSVPAGTDRIMDSAVTSDKIALGAVITARLGDGSVTSAKIVDGTVVAQDLADGSIITVKVEDGAITAAKIADSSITTAKIADSAVVTVKLIDDAVTTSKIADDAISTAKLADGVVTAAKLADNAIISVKLSDGSVSSAKILDGTITAVDLADGSITTTKIVDKAITTEKIADGAVTAEKVADGAAALALFNGNAILFQTDFESIDGYATGTDGAASSVVLGAGEVELKAGASTGNYAALSFVHDNYLMETRSTFDRNKMFRTLVQILGRTSQTIYVTYGEAMKGIETSPHFGFKIVNAKIYGSVADGTTQSLTVSELYTITDDFVEFEARFYSGRWVEFYINGVYKGLVATSLPSGTEVNYVPLNLCITVDEDTIRTINVARWFTLQEA